MPGFSHDFQHGTDSTNTWSEAQTFSTGVILGPDAVFTFPTSSSVPTVSSSGQAIWDSTHEVLIIANGSSGRHFIPTEGISGDGTISTAGVMTVTGGGGVSVGSTNTWTAQQTFTTGINLTAGQLIFPATQIASADANTLDDYEEGTFTPTVQDDTLSDTEGQTYLTQIGRYAKIGNTVFFQTQIQLTSLGTLTGSQTAKMAGLPFTSNDVTNNRASVHIGRAGNLVIAAESAPAGYIDPNTAVIVMSLWDSSMGVTGLTLDEVTADGLLNYAGHYEV